MCLFPNIRKETINITSEKGRKKDESLLKCKVKLSLFFMGSLSISPCQQVITAWVLHQGGVQKNISEKNVFVYSVI